VGRAVIREALRFLENSGLIHIRMGATGGVFVKNIDPSTLANTFEGIVRLSNVSLEELTAARMAIETASFKMTSGKFQDEDLRRLEQSIEEARQALEMGIEEPKNRAFHILLANISGNRLLTGIIESLHELETKFVYAYGYSYPRKKRFLQEHEQVLKLLKEGNHEEAVRVFELHIENSVREFGLPVNKT
jgi:DNA-binding FadR family transcriptional regulator